MEENIGKKLLEISFGNDFLVITPKVSATKAKPDKWDYINLKTKTWYSKGYNQQNKKATYGMGENICKPYMIKGMGYIYI